MKIYSHRGESSYAQENSLKAFYLAEINKSDGIETDVRKTKDNVLVLWHDKTIDRLSSSKGKICNMTYEELLKINDISEKIVTLDEFLKFFSNKKILLDIEIKEEGIENDVYKLIQKYNAKNIIITSFKYNILENIRSIDSNILLGLLLKNVTNKDIDLMKKIKIKMCACLSISITEDDVMECHKNNIVVFTWGILGKIDIQRLKSIKVDGIIVNSYKDSVKYAKK